ncbi:RluA family pseudouridine synthase [Candidatus Viridilinea mediisalina]|uniref:Pseudouridine synthase n=1 Tax=Candidatus Viridilinea mediisalina TaxID=2024553 RepID=A0A2A6RP52_9CHLR|nr:RluA family pseudouridine synthase [Candidatus Viridilinea mediisalina]PDW04620.1 RluA family pseudouridine synthase [Candidatus Viridilinea mediisalina]
MYQTDTIELYVTSDAAGERLDRFVARTVADLSRSFAQQLIGEGHVTVNGRLARASLNLRGGERVQVQLPPPQPTQLIPEAIPLHVVHEDSDIVVVDKPAGMVVHPAPGHSGGTLVNALLARYPDMQTGGSLRPGIVHRLDQGTSGLLVVARHDLALQALTEQQRARTMLKLYLAVVEGHFREPLGVIDAPIARHATDRVRMVVSHSPKARPARTHYRVLEELGAYSLLELRLETGRTHQIRVHMLHRNRPILGDPMYGGQRQRPSFGLTRQFLHAQRLGFYHPRDAVWREFSTPLPADLHHALERLRGKR